MCTLSRELGYIQEHITHNQRMIIMKSIIEAVEITIGTLGFIVAVFAIMVLSQGF